MNYYEHHLGDWAQATAHLSMLETGAYQRLIQWYYAEERQLPLDERAVFRIARASSEQEREAVRAVLADFFELREDGYHQPRCDREIERYREKRDRARNSANMRWQCDRNASASESDANASNPDAKAMLRTQPSHADRNALQSPVSNPQSPEEEEGRTPHTPRKRGAVVERFDPGDVTGLDPEAWVEWVTYRAKRKPAIKPASMRKAAEQMAALGDGQRAAVDHSIANGYQGLIAPKEGANGRRVTRYEQAQTALDAWDRGRRASQPVLAFDGRAVRSSVDGPVRTDPIAAVVDRYWDDDRSGGEARDALADDGRPRSPADAA